MWWCITFGSIPWTKTAFLRRAFTRTGSIACSIIWKRFWNRYLYPLRVFAFVQTAGVHLAMLISLKLLCKNRYTPYFGTLLYVLLKGIDPVTYLRFNAALPQEHGMLYILPVGALAIRFFRNMRWNAGRKRRNKSRCGTGGCNGICWDFFSAFPLH